MLFEMLDDISAEIAELDRHQAAGVFADQLMMMKPSLPRGLFESPDDEEVRWAAERLSQSYLSLISDIPWYVHTLSAAAKDPHMEGGYRAAILGSLAYLVQPRDLIPDDLPGGFGFIDDCLLLHVTTMECIAYLPRDTSSETRELLLANYLSLTIPDQRLTTFREAAEGIRHLIFHLGLLDPEPLEQAISALIESPLAPGPAANPCEYRTSSAPSGSDVFAAPTGMSVSEEGRIVFEFPEGKVSVFGSEIETD